MLKPSVGVSILHRGRNTLPVAVKCPALKRNIVLDDAAVDNRSVHVVIPASKRKFVKKNAALDNTSL